jgi:hypothetical protein
MFAESARPAVAALWDRAPDALRVRRTFGSRLSGFSAGYFFSVASRFAISDFVAAALR